MVRRLRIGDEIHAGGSVLRVVGWENGRLLLACEPLTPAVRFVKRVDAVELNNDSRCRLENRAIESR